MKYRHGYVAGTAIVVFNLLSISARAQVLNDKQPSPPYNSVPHPSANDSGPEQTPAPFAADPRTQPSDPLQSRSYSTPGAGSDAALSPFGQSQDVNLFGRASVLSRRMMDRARQILVLRRLLALHFSADDIAVALPLLRRLNDIKAAPPVDPERALESEYEALLTARPGDRLPPSSAVKITDAARYYREEQAKIWSEMTRKLGKSKADGLNNLLGQQDQATAPLSSGQTQRLRPDSVPAASPDDRPLFPNDAVPPTPNPGAPADPSLDFRPNLPRPDSDRQRGRSRSDVDPADTAPRRSANQVPNPDPRNRRSATPTRDQYRNDPLSSVSEPRRNGAGNRALSDQSSDYSLLVYSSTTIRISLSELIDLMETKLSVMSRAGSGEQRSR